MDTFDYKARDYTGKLIRGAITAVSPDEAARQLQQRGYTPIGIQPVVESFDLKQVLDRFIRIKTEDLIIFNLQLSNMLGAGIGIITALETQQKQCPNKRLKKIIGRIKDKVETGESLSSALAGYPAIFPSIFVSMVKAAEASGDLSKILNRYAEFAEAQAEIQRKIKEALFYPVILIAASIGVIVFLATFLIPRFVEVFSKAEIALPLPTTILFIFGNAIQKYWYFIVPAGVLLALGIKKSLSIQCVRVRFDAFCLKIPILGPVIRKRCVSRFSRTLSTLLCSGVPILESLDIVREVMNNKVLAHQVELARQRVEKGHSLADSFGQSREFPVDATQMISIGEESGQLEKMLNKVSDFYDRAVSYSIKKMVASLEPALLIVMGAVTAFTISSMLLPMFDMVKILKR